jgi:uncharacterized membrane-anchored protein YhcB (DUF1043 family)
MNIIISFFIGVIIGIVLMCILQINKEKNVEKLNISEKSKMVKINDLVDEYRKGKNPFTVLRDITNLVKGW